MKNKICMICKLGIDDKKEFAEFKHWEFEGKLRSRSFYHVECFRERILENKVIEKQAQGILAKADSMLNELAGVQA